MKKLTSLLAFMMMLALPFALVSCDDDEDIADTLWGTWEGDMYVTSYWNGKEYRSSYSVIEFDKDYDSSTSGTGYWIDYYDDPSWNVKYYATHIRWSVSKGVIYIFSIEDETAFYIGDYSLSDNYFRGTIFDDYDNDMSFSLVKTSSPYWDSYDKWGWDAWGYGYPNYSNKKKSAAGTPVENSATERPVRRIVRPE